MQYFSLLLVLLLSIFISSCSSSYKELSNNDFEVPNKFSKYLLKEYKSKADFEAKEMHDWNSTKLYSEKALKAVKGIKIQPEKIEYWNIPNNKLKELKISYNNLMIVYEEALILNPYNLAKAISSLDCWAEQQEENWQTWDINECKDAFLSSMNQIYESLENKKETKKNSINKSNNNSVSVVTKNKKEEILQLIYFNFDKSDLWEKDIFKIKDFVDKYNDQIENYLIVGHTDTKGSEEYNKILSLNRAKAVKEILITSGIIESRISILGEGEKNLRIKTEDEVAHPANRRAEIKPLN